MPPHVCHQVAKEPVQVFTDDVPATRQHTSTMSWTLLIVDDHACFRAAGRAPLDADPFTVIGEASTEGQGLTEVVRLCPEIVLLDVQLPDRDGFEVAELMARSPCRPYVLLTSRWDHRPHGGATRPGSAGDTGNPDNLGAGDRSAGRPGSPLGLAVIATRSGAVRGSPLRLPDPIAGACEHLAAAEVPQAPTSVAGCRRCLAEGLRWVHLRSRAHAGRLAAAIRRRAGTPRRTSTRPVTRSSAASSPGDVALVLRRRGRRLTRFRMPTGR